MPATRCKLETLLPTLRHVEAGALPEPAARWGQVNAAAGASTVASVTAALYACRRNEFDAVIACPHHETAIHQAGIPFSGYPSLLACVCGVTEGEVLLLLVGGGLRIIHVTLQEGVRPALDRLKSELVQNAVRAGVMACALLGVSNPSVGVFGNNPHASEGRLWGPEDATIVVSALAALRAEGLAVDGPQGADVLLSQGRHELYVAMLHDQGHILSSCWHRIARVRSAWAPTSCWPAWATAARWTSREKEWPTPRRCCARSPCSPICGWWYDASGEHRGRRRFVRLP